MSRAWWLARGFNVAMRARNALIKPSFVMFVLTFLWPAAKSTLEETGFSVTAEPLPRKLADRSQGQSRFVVVTARRKD
jgi:hypothetical protein